MIRIRVIMLCTAILITAACSDDDQTPTKPVNDPFDPEDATLLRAGTFMGDGNHSVSGNARIYDAEGMLVLQFDNFSSSNGPDLKVYLSKTEDASEFISLGDLKSVTGRQSYDFPGMTALDEYRFVLIWCEEFSVLFGKAETQP